jgi:hypothetical protein
MADSDNQWTTALSCAPMFVELEIEKERIRSIEDYVKNSDYAKNKLTACSPFWWDNKDVGSERETEVCSNMSSIS